MNIQNLITTINNEIPMAMYEMEYEYENNPHLIDLRLYGANQDGAEIIKNMIIAHDFNGVDGATVETPAQSEIDYGFSGHKFVRIIIEVARTINRGTKDHYLINDSGRII